MQIMTKTPFSVEGYLLAHQNLRKSLNFAEIDDAIAMIGEAVSNNKKIVTCGNGGSALTASHYITDWNKMINLATGKKFRGISLADNVGLITAFGNDLSYEDVFIGQARAILDEGDLLVAISGSGNSPNVIKVVEYANSVGARTLGIVGYDGGKIKQIAHKSVWVNSMDMKLCEDVHLMFGHMVMKTLCGSPIIG